MKEFTLIFLEDLFNQIDDSELSQYILEIVALVFA